MSDLIRGFRGDEVNPALSSSWVQLFTQDDLEQEYGKGADGVLVANRTGADIEINNNDVSAIGWYKIPADSTFFVPFSEASLTDGVWAKGSGTTYKAQLVQVS